MGETQQKIEYVDYVVNLPKEALEFLESQKEGIGYSSVKAYIESSILQTILGDIENGAFLFLNMKNLLKQSLSKIEGKNFG